MEAIGKILEYFTSIAATDIDPEIDQHRDGIGNYIRLDTRENTVHLFCW